MMIIDLEIQAEIQLLEKVAKQKPNAEEWIDKRITVLIHAFDSIKELELKVNQQFKEIGNLSLEVGQANVENIELGRALAVANKTLTSADQL